MDIGPGDAVECVRGLEYLVEGRVYFVDRLVTDMFNPTCDDCGGKGPGIRLVNDPNDFKIWQAWCPCQFRPYHGPEVEVGHWRKSRPVYGKSPAFNMLDLVRQMNEEKRKGKGA